MQEASASHHLHGTSMSPSAGVSTNNNRYCLPKFSCINMNHGLQAQDHALSWRKKKHNDNSPICTHLATSIWGYVSIFARQLLPSQCTRIGGKHAFIIIIVSVTSCGSLSKRENLIRVGAIVGAETGTHHAPSAQLANMLSKTSIITVCWGTQGHSFRGNFALKAVSLM